MLSYISVCSGIEAATVAWHDLGWKPAGFAEIEKFPAAVLAHHYPSVPNRGDMTKFKTWPDEPIDLLVGGTPCQAFSVAGLRKGLDDPRGNLTLTFLALARKYRPGWVVWENVPGVLSDRTNAFGQFLAGLGELGYGWSYRVLDAQYFGVAQRRRRVFVVGHLGDWRRAAAVLFERESLRGDSAPRREPRERVTGTLSARTEGGGGLGTDFDLAGGVIARALTTKNQRNDAETETLLPMRRGGFFDGPTHALKGEGHDASEDGTGRGVPITLAIRGRDGAPSLETRADGLANAILTPNGGRAGVGVGAVAFYANQAGDTALGMSKEGVPPVRRTQPIGLLQGMSVRRLTARECERLQGFPDDYTLIPWRGKPAPDGPRYKALGNSMAVPVMAWIGRRIAIADTLLADAQSP